jgi:hypothetical protein
MADSHSTNQSVHGGGDQKAADKKPFEPPRLTVYGDITMLTRMVGRLGNTDGGKGVGNPRTHS